jgi:hypothetical protein
LIAKVGHGKLSSKSLPVSAILIAREPKACGDAACSWKIAHISTLYDAAHAASVTIDGVAVVAGFI